MGLIITNLSPEDAESIRIGEVFLVAANDEFKFLKIFKNNEEKNPTYNFSSYGEEFHTTFYMSSEIFGDFVQLLIDIERGEGTNYIRRIGSARGPVYMKVYYSPLEDSEHYVLSVSSERQQNDSNMICKMKFRRDKLPWVFSAFDIEFLRGEGKWN